MCQVTVLLGRTGNALGTHRMLHCYTGGFPGSFCFITRLRSWKPLSQSKSLHSLGVQQLGLPERPCFVQDLRTPWLHLPATFKPLRVSPISSGPLVNASTLHACPSLPATQLLLPRIALGFGSHFVTGSQLWCLQN